MFANRNYTSTCFTHGIHLAVCDVLYTKKGNGDNENQVDIDVDADIGTNRSIENHTFCHL